MPFVNVLVRLRVLFYLFFCFFRDSILVPFNNSRPNEVETGDWLPSSDDSFRNLKVRILLQ